MLHCVETLGAQKPPRDWRQPITDRLVIYTFITIHQVPLPSVKLTTLNLNLLVYNRVFFQIFFQAGGKHKYTYTSHDIQYW